MKNICHLYSDSKPTLTAQHVHKTPHEKKFHWILFHPWSAESIRSSPYFDSLSTVVSQRFQLAGKSAPVSLSSPSLAWCSDISGSDSRYLGWLRWNWMKLSETPKIWQPWFHKAKNGELESRNSGKHNAWWEVLNCSPFAPCFRLWFVNRLQLLQTPQLDHGNWWNLWRTAQIRGCDVLTGMGNSHFGPATLKYVETVSWLALL